MNLSKGSHGPNVRRLQISLNLLAAAPPARAVAGGSKLAKLVEDGILGPKTLARVIEFQRQALLPADGVAGPRTVKSLLASVAGTVFRSSS